MSTETQLKETIDEGMKIGKDLLDRSEELQKQIDAGGSVVELKQEIANLSVANGETVASLKELRETLEKEANERIIDADRIANIDTALKDIRMNGTGRNGVAKKTAGLLLAEAAKDVDWESKARTVAVTLDEKDQLPGLIKDITNAAGSGEDLIVPFYVPGIIPPGTRQLRIANLLPSAQIGTLSVIFMRENVATDGAEGQTPQGEVKGESDLTFTQDTEDVVTIATWLKVSTQMLDDVTALGGYINTRLGFFVLQHTDEQLLTGDGTAGNLNGLVTQATAWDTTLPADMGVASATDIDNLRTAIYQVWASNFVADGIVLNPFNWAAIELEKTTTNEYLFARPQGVATPALWGLPVVNSFSMTQGSFLVGAFQMGAQIWRRQGLRIAISTEDEDNFQRNLATIRAEERLALTVYRTLAFVTGSLSVGSGS